ncbi:MAG: site-specific DNA-methyltransferase [Patescibacteria group bacterium]|nr:site-specific DNA-methyltransferase [Patescibacteria group bacterium]MDE2438688.1 site-specific DNA-methyltransferase [Patescibacteria group bacterium]
MQITDVKKYEKNAKEHPGFQLEKIASSIKAFGCKQPIILGKDGTIIVGHGRFIAMTELLGYTLMDEKAFTKKGEPVVPYVMVDDLSEEEIKAYRIADNQLNALTGQDMILIVDELKDLDAAGFDITLTGFDRDIILENDEQDDVLPETPKEPKSKLGDVFQLGPHIVVCGDSTDKDAWLKAFQTRKADMVFTDPPYNVNYAGRGKKTSEGIMNDDMDSEAFDSFLEKAFGCIADFAKSGAGWYVFHSTSTQAQFEKALKKYGMAIRNQLIWNKPTASMGWGDYRWKHEPFFYASKDGTETVFYGDRTHSTIIDFHESELKLLNWAKQQKKLETEGKFTIWTMKRDRVNEYQHPTQKPVELITYALANSSKAEDLVADPFLGSGSTLIACEKTGRACAGIELDPKFVDVIVQRWVDYTGTEQVVRNGQPEIWPKTIYEHESEE